MAYQSDRSGQREVYISAMADPAGTLWPVSVGGGHKPVWSLSGDTVFYFDPQGSLMAAPVERGETLRVGQVSELIPDLDGRPFPGGGGRNMDASPLDGRLLFVKQEAPSRVPGMRVALNWAQNALTGVD